MKHCDFVHLHNPSDYSLLDGARPIPAMVRRAAALQMPALALTDHGAMFGAVEFYQEARKAGVKPIVGMEAYVTRGRLGDRNPNDTAHHLVLLARDERGVKNLMRLPSPAYLQGLYYQPRRRGLAPRSPPPRPRARAGRAPRTRRACSRSPPARKGRWRATCSPTATTRPCAPPACTATSSAPTITSSRSRTTGSRARTRSAAR